MTFSFYNPVRLYFGAGEFARAGREAKKLGRKALLVSYRHPTRIQWIVQKVEEMLSAENVEFVDFYQILPNPELGQIEQAADLCRSSGIDFLIGVGGGSVMDSTKAIAAAAVYEGELWDMFVSSNDGSTKHVPPTRALPLMLIPTVPATSSEMNSAAVITNKNTNVKGFVFNEVLYPKLSIVDPQLTVSLPAYLTACGAIDAISHNFEPYFNSTQEYPVHFGLEESLVSTIMDLLPQVLRDPENVELRGQLQWAVLVSHNGWAKTGVAYFSALHMLGHPLSSRFGLHHGAAMGIVIPAWMEYVVESRLDKFVCFAQEIMGVDNLGKEEKLIAEEGIERFRSFISGTGVPTSMSMYREQNITEADLSLLTEDALRLGADDNGKIKGNPVLSGDDVLKIYQIAY